MSGTTTINGLRYATLSDVPNAQTLSQNLANDVDTRIIPRFPSTAARDAAIPSPVEGMYCDVASVGLQRYSGSAWVTYGAQTTTFIRKSADESVTSSTTFQDDNELASAVSANSVYEFTFRLFVRSHASGDFKCELTFPASSELDVFRLGPALAVTSGVDTTANLQSYAADTTSPTQSMSLGAIESDAVFVMLTGTLTTGASSGTLQLRWAQNSSNATATTVHEGSTLRLDKIS